MAAMPILKKKDLKPDRARRAYPFATAGDRLFLGVILKGFDHEIVAEVW